MNLYVPNVSKVSTPTSDLIDGICFVFEINSFPSFTCVNSLPSHSENVASFRPFPFCSPKGWGPSRGDLGDPTGLFSQQPRPQRAGFTGTLVYVASLTTAGEGTWMLATDRGRI